MHSIALGTVQLGLQYGIANSLGQPCYDTAKNIVRTALEGGVNWIDTAVLYGQSESVIGRCLDELDDEVTQGVKVITKLPSLRGLSAIEMDTLLEESLGRLRCDSIEGVMLHNAQDLYEIGDETLNHFFNYRESRKVRKVGVSVYSAEQAIHAISTYEIDMIQFQSNLFDRSFVEAGVFELCAEKGIDVFVRSIFLQGLFFLSDKDPRLEKIKGAGAALRVLRGFCEEHNCSVSELCFADASRFKGASIVIGAESPMQVSENLNNALRSEKLLYLLEKWDRKRPIVTTELTNPVFWNKER